MNTSTDSRLVATLGSVVLTVAVLQTAVVPILASIATQLQVTPAEASWAVTANLLAAAATTPLIGRLADLFNKKSVLLATLAVVVAGSLLGAVTASLPLLVLGRALQGTSFALYPIAVSIVRDELPTERLIRAIAALSTTLGLGGALALLFTGFLMPDGASYHRVFWLLSVMTIAAFALAAVVVPSRPQRVVERVDWVGAAALAAGLSSLMLAITQGTSWGWASSRTIAAASAGAATLAMWHSWTRRSRHPLVSTEMLTRRPILLANSAGFLVGMGSYFSLLGLSSFAGYGFGAGAQGISLQFMLPGAIAATGTALAAGRLIERFGARLVVAAGGVAGVVGFVMLAGWHTERWQVIVAGLLTNAYISLAYGALPAMIVGEVGPGETGVANSLNGIFRKVGGAAAAAMVAALLTPAGGGSPSEGGFLAVFVAGALTAAGLLVLVWLGRVKVADRASRVPLLLRLVPVPAA